MVSPLVQGSDKSEKRSALFVRLCTLHWTVIKTQSWTSLVAQWIRTHLPKQGHRFDPWSWKIPHTMKELNPICHNHSAWALEPMSHDSGSLCLEPGFCNKRSHLYQKPLHHNKDYPPLTATRGSLRAARKTQHSWKTNKQTKTSISTHLKNQHISTILLRMWAPPVNSAMCSLLIHQEEFSLSPCMFVQSLVWPLKKERFSFSWYKETSWLENKLKQVIFHVVKIKMRL